MFDIKIILKDSTKKVLNDSFSNPGQVQNSTMQKETPEEAEIQKKFLDYFDKIKSSDATIDDIQNFEKTHKEYWELLKKRKEEKLLKAKKELDSLNARNNGGMASSSTPSSTITKESEFLKYLKKISFLLEEEKKQMSDTIQSELPDENGPQFEPEKPKSETSQIPATGLVFMVELALKALSISPENISDSEKAIFEKSVTQENAEEILEQIQGIVSSLYPK